MRKDAPEAFRTQERAVTTEDYAEVAQRHPQVQRAAATMRWTGSWHTSFSPLTASADDPSTPSSSLSCALTSNATGWPGTTWRSTGRSFVSLEVEMKVCVKPNYFRSDVHTALLEVFSNRALIDGRRGVFHPDNFSFGQTVYLSPLYAAAQAVEGVHFVDIKKFQRFGSTAQPRSKRAGSSSGDSRSRGSTTIRTFPKTASSA